MKKLFLHIGTHKTGSTSIQKFCEENRNSLEQRGLLYPDYQPFVPKAPYAHHQFAKAVADQGRELSFGEAEQLAHQWSEHCEAHGLNLLISAEPMYRLELRESAKSRDKRRLEYFKRLKNLFPKFEIQPIVVFRRPDSLIESLYRENIMTNHPSAKVDFTKFIEENHKRFFSYGTTAEILETCFGRKLAVYFFENLVKSELPMEHQFLQDIRCNVADLPTIGKVRESLNNAQIMVKHTLNEFISNEKQSNKVTAWLKLPETELLLEECFPNHKSFSLWKNSSGKEKCMALANKELISLGRILDIDPAEMFPSIKEVDGQLPMRKPTVNEISRIMLSALEYSDYNGLPSSSKAYRK